jgi:2-iminoacetate synthase
MQNSYLQKWLDNVIKEDQIERYLNKGRDFIEESHIDELLLQKEQPEIEEIRSIIAKSLELQRLEPAETAALLNCRQEDLWQEMFAAALTIKEKVYGRRIVIFAPLYLSNYCVNSCVYCGFRQENEKSSRQQLTREELQEEIKVLIGKGHKRLVMVYGEHPLADVDYIADTLATAYSTKAGNGEIRRVNVNAAPLSLEDLRILRGAGIGTFQVFQETYHHQTYRQMHPRGLKAHYRWRLYAQHRAQEAGVNDVGIGALFGLYNWKYEVMGLLAHTIDLEKKFGGTGPHTISMPRLEPALNTPFAAKSPHKIDNEAFKKLVTVIRLSVPYTGMILTARENPAVRQEIIPLGISQIDAGSAIGIGSYARNARDYSREQFLLGDNRSLDEAIRDLAAMGKITSFCTADYRCGRTGNCFMNMAKSAKIHNLCMPNAILTFKEYLLYYASEETKKVGNPLISRELSALTNPAVREKCLAYLQRIEAGERDLFF